jgi:hypothetical protein
MTSCIMKLCRYFERDNFRFPYQAYVRLIRYQVMSNVNSKIFCEFYNSKIFCE